MGFGLLFIGYVLKFILGMNGAFDLALTLPACVLMLVGLHKLSRYCHSFRYAKYLSLAILAAEAVCVIDALLVWSGPTLPEGAGIVQYYLAFAESFAGTRPVDFAAFFAALLFHGALSMAVKELALRVELKKNAVRALRNLVIVGLYASVWVLMRTVSALSGVLMPASVLLELVCAVSYAVMLFSCYMYICPAEQPVQEKRRSRFAWVNRLRDAAEQREQRAREADEAFYAQMARQRREKQLSRMSEKQRRAQRKKESGKKK